MTDRPGRVFPRPSICRDCLRACTHDYAPCPFCEPCEHAEKPKCPACGQPVQYERQHQEKDVQNGYGWYCPKVSAPARLQPRDTP